MEGRCQCGTIRFTTPTAHPLKIYICHCTECRHQSSSAYGVTAVFPWFELPNSKSVPDDHIGVHIRASPITGRDRECLFCRTCGSRLIHREKGKDTLSVKGGCLTDVNKDMMRTAVHIWMRSAVIDVPDVLPDGTKVEKWDEEPGQG